MKANQLTQAPTTKVDSALCKQTIADFFKHTPQAVQDPDVDDPDAMWLAAQKPKLWRRVEIWKPTAQNVHQLATTTDAQGETQVHVYEPGTWPESGVGDKLIPLSMIKQVRLFELECDEGDITAQTVETHSGQVLISFIEVH